MSLFSKNGRTPPSGRRASGYAGEKMAAEFLKKKKYKILETNFTVKGGEIDLVALDGDCLVFVEVKLRNAEDTPYFGQPASAVNAEKRKRMIRAAFRWLSAHPSDFPVRFDVIEIEYTLSGDKKEYTVNHITDAFVVPDSYFLFQ